MTKRPVLGGLALIALIVVTPACSDDDGNGGAAATSTTSAGRGVTLEGTGWTLEDVAGLAPGASGTITARFDDGSVGGTSACNRYSAPYEIDGSSLTIGPEIAGTKMACTPGPTAAERAFQTLLVEVGSFAIDGDVLTLADEAGTVLLTFRAAGARDLVGAWEVTGFYTGSAIESPRAGPTLTAEFGVDGVSGNGGCNRFSGPVTTDGDTLAIGPLASTLMACTDEALTTQEQQYTSALELARTYSVAGDRLELFREDGGLAVTFQRMGAPS